MYLLLELRPPAGEQLVDSAIVVADRQPGDSGLHAGAAQGEDWIVKPNMSLIDSFGVYVRC